MSNHSEQQQPQELRQSLLNELEASQKAITELSDEELEQVAGGRIGLGKLALGGTAAFLAYKFMKKNSSKQGGQNPQNAQYPQNGQYLQ